MYKRNSDIAAFAQMSLIRQFEQQLLDFFQAGIIHGTTHTSIGQEAVAYAVAGPLQGQADLVVSNHRCHGHYIAKTDDTKGLLAEIMGRVGGVCNGWGGSQHLRTADFMSNGIQGNFLPVAAGCALSNRLSENKEIVVSFIGDGTLGEGIVYETMNLCALYEIPLVVIVEDNKYAQTTSVEANLAGSIPARFKAFGIETYVHDLVDPVKTRKFFLEHYEERRCKPQPVAHVINTYRLAAHSKGDDFRSNDEIEKMDASDPLNLLRARLLEDDKSLVQEVEHSIANRLKSEYDSILNWPEAK